MKIIVMGSRRPCLQLRKESGIDSQKPQLMTVAIGVEHAGILLPSPGCSIFFWPTSAGPQRSSMAGWSARQAPGFWQPQAIESCSAVGLSEAEAPTSTPSFPW